MAICTTARTSASRPKNPRNSLRGQVTRGVFSAATKSAFAVCPVRKLISPTKHPGRSSTARCSRYLDPRATLGDDHDPIDPLAVRHDALVGGDIFPARDAQQLRELALREATECELVEPQLVGRKTYGPALEQQHLDLPQIDREEDDVPADRGPERDRQQRVVSDEDAACDHREEAQPEDLLHQVRDDIENVGDVDEDDQEPQFRTSMHSVRRQLRTSFASASVSIRSARRKEPHACSSMLVRQAGHSTALRSERLPPKGARRSAFGCFDKLIMGLSFPVGMKTGSLKTKPRWRAGARSLNWASHRELPRPRSSLRSASDSAARAASSAVTAPQP